MNPQERQDQLALRAYRLWGEDSSNTIREALHMCAYGIYLPDYPGLHAAIKTGRKVTIEFEHRQLKRWYETPLPGGAEGTNSPVSVGDAAHGDTVDSAPLESGITNEIPEIVSKEKISNADGIGIMSAWKFAQEFARLVEKNHNSTIGYDTSDILEHMIWMRDAAIRDAVLEPFPEYKRFDNKDFRLVGLVYSSIQDIGTEIICRTYPYSTLKSKPEQENKKTCPTIGCRAHEGGMSCCACLAKPAQEAQNNARST